MTEEQSHFNYFNKSYDDFNSGWNTTIPAFMADFDGVQLEACEGDLQCLFDYAVTGNVSIAVATHTITMENMETVNILGNKAISLG